MSLCLDRYEWDESFALESFCESIESFNEREAEGFLETYNYISESDITVSAARVTYGSSVNDVLTKEKNIQIPLILKKSFMDFANTTVLKALEEAGIKDCPPPLAALEKDHDGERAFLWQLNSVLNWQMIDRRIDE